MYKVIVRTTDGGYYRFDKVKYIGTVGNDFAIDWFSRYNNDWRVEYIPHNSIKKINVKKLK